MRTSLQPITIDHSDAADSPEQSFLSAYRKRRAQVRISGVSCPGLVAKVLKFGRRVRRRFAAVECANLSLPGRKQTGS